MALVVQPPNENSLVSMFTDSTGLFAIFTSPEFQALVRRANEEYLHWHNFRYRTFPPDVKPETAWAYVKLGRIANKKPVPFEDINGNQFSYWIPDALLKAL